MSPSTAIIALEIRIPDGFPVTPAVSLEVVLVAACALIDADGRVLIAQRPPGKSMAGLWEFPGGKIEPGDPSPAAAALREAQEEIGLDPGLVDPIGHLDLYLTFSGFRILPTVARIDPGHRLTLNRAEVDEAFEVPLAFLMDAQNHALHSRDWKGVIRRYYAMPFGERYIWGVTAGILRNLYEKVYG